MFDGGVWSGVAAILDFLSRIGGLLLGLVVLALGGSAILQAKALQKRLVAALTAHPQAQVSWRALELRSSLPGLLWLPVERLARWIYGGVVRLRNRLRGTDSTSGAAPAPAKSEAEPLLVATLGPSFLLGGLATASLWLLARLAEPLLRARFALSAGAAVWQFLFFGRRPELGAYLPLGEHPFVGALLSVLFWMAVWTSASRAVRFVLRDRLCRNLASERDDGSVLRLWRDGAGATWLFRPAVSYSVWASWVVAGAFPLLLWSWFSLDGEPWRVAGSEWALAFILWLAWAIHLLLRGHERIPAAVAGEDTAGERQVRGWPDVLESLRKDLQAAEPLPFRAARRVEPLQHTSIPPEAEGVLSPLLLELLPEPGRLTVMQRIVLTDLSLQAFVHVEPPVSREALALPGVAEEGLQDRSGLRHRNEIVLAHEATGKSTLAVLAAANHALIHTRATLVIARDEDHEAALDARFRSLIEPSTLRWNVRVRRMGADLMGDLSRGIVPDVVLCSLHQLVVRLLADFEGLAPFLQGLGLIVVDDAELFYGPVEAHAQLAFRRLTARLGRLLKVQTLGERSAPLVLVLAADSMHDLPAWARSLCGIDAVVRDFTRTAAELEEQEAAEMAARGLAVRPAEEDKDAQAAHGEAKNGRHHRFYRLRDFVTAAGENLGIADLVNTCEKLAVPWCYRPCGDGRRRLGRLPLLLRDEPKHFVDVPEEACVAFLEGRWSEVRRELHRLRRAGVRFRDNDAPEPIALITLVDPDEEMAFTQLDRRFGLAETLAHLPWPIVRPPSRQVVHSHLAADLVQHWMEVDEVLKLFGHATAQTLRRLSRGGLLLVDRRMDVHPEAYEYVQRVYVRAMARATLREAIAEAAPLLPAPVSQVQWVSRRTVALRDRTRLAVPLEEVDASAAPFLYYPGRIFTDARGSYVVIGRAAGESQTPGIPLGKNDILVEPILADDISSPRRRVTVSLLPEGELEEQAAPPEPVLYGRHSVKVALLPVRVTPRHVATYRLGPVLCEVRQRLLREDEQAAASPLETWALAILPNPAAGDPSAPKLLFGESRLIAAALRSVLLSMVRGAAESIEVAIHLDKDAQADRELESGEGFFLFDLDQGGNGTARALHRDGIETLLRLCRLFIERVLYPDRLLALHDDWGDEDEILAGGDLPSGTAGDDTQARAEVWARYAKLREGALAWLDSRLRREGRAEGAQEGTVQSGSGFQQGEGDAIDFGRCWFSRYGGVADLVWAKHRWRLPNGGEAMLDVAFDRRTVAEARRFTDPGNAPVLARYRSFHDAWLSSEDKKLTDGTVWGRPRGVWVPDRDGKTAEIATDGLANEALAGYHAMAEAIAAQGWPTLSILAGVLRNQSGAAGEGEAERLQLLKYLSHFVQGVPYSVPDAVNGGLRPPVSTLLYRLADCDSKSLLLALLALHCGIDAGLFVSFADRHAVAAMAAPDPSPAEAAESTGPRPVPSRLEAWSEMAGLGRLPAAWAEMPVSPEAGDSIRIYVPVESTAYSTAPVGGARLDQTKTWVFLPLTAASLGVPNEEGDTILISDRAELEDR